MVSHRICTKWHFYIFIFNFRNFHMELAETAGIGSFFFAPKKGERKNMWCVRCGGLLLHDVDDVGLRLIHSLIHSRIHSLFFAIDTTDSSPVQHVSVSVQSSQEGHLLREGHWHQGTTSLLHYGTTTLLHCT